MYYKDEEKDINLLLSRVKKNPNNFKDRILAKLKQFNEIFEIIKKKPADKSIEFNNLCMFFGQIFEYFPKELRVILEALMQLFEIYGTNLNPSTRIKIIQTLLIVQKKGYIDFLKSFNFFIKIFGYKDKKLRKLVFYYFLKNIKNMQKKKVFGKIESPLINIIRKILDESSNKIAKRLLRLLMRLYYKATWTSKKLVNVIAESIKLKDQKTNLMTARFLISTAEQMHIEDDDTDEENETLKELTKKFGRQYKNSKKKIEKLERQIKNVKKKEKRLAKLNTLKNIYPIDMLYNPHKYVEILLQKLQKKHIKYTLKMEIMCLLGRLIGRYRLIHPTYHSYIVRFVRPEIKNSDRLFAFLAESVHENSIIEEVELICKRLIQNFVAEGFGEEKITIGINTLRMILMRNEHCMGSEDINYVANFRNYKHKSVCASARSFINLVRDLCPDMLDKEFHVYVRRNDIDQTVKKKGEMVGRIEGVELLNEDGKLNVECDRILTDNDFKRIRKLKNKKIMQGIRERSAVEESLTRAIDMPRFSVIEMKKKYEELTKGLKFEGELNDDEINELINEKLIDSDSEDEEDNEDDEKVEFEKNEKEGEVGEGEIKMEDDEEGEIEDESGTESDMEIEDEDENIELLDEEEVEMKRRGFITQSMINTYASKRNRKSQKSNEIYQSMIEKKFGFRKKNKKGSKTNAEKAKSQPYMMIIDKINSQKKHIKSLRRKIGKKKEFTGHVGKRLS